MCDDSDDSDVCGATVVVVMRESSFPKAYSEVRPLPVVAQRGYATHRGNLEALFRAAIDQLTPRNHANRRTLHPTRIDRIQTFSHDPAGDNDKIFMFEYDLEDATFPLRNSVSSFAFPTGVSLQEDVVEESAISATGTIGENLASRTACQTTTSSP